MHVVPINIKEANEFIFSFHRHNKPTVGGRWAIGLEHDGELIGVAIVGRPIARMNENGFTAEVTRVCVRDNSPKGANSMLYAACWRAWRAMGGKKIITYTLKDESGASLRGAGWKVIGNVVPSGDWGSSKRKRDWQPVFGQLKLKWERNI